MEDDAFLMGVMAGRTGDAAPRHQRKYHQLLAFGLLHVLQCFRLRLYQEMLAEENTRHGRMAPPAEISYVGLEANIFRPVHSRVRLFSMAHEAHGLAVHRSHLAMFVKHDVRIDRGILFHEVALKADNSSVRIGPSPQERRPCTNRTTVDIMAREAPYLSSIERERISRGLGGLETDGMVVFTVIMAVKADRGWIAALFKGSEARFRFCVRMAVGAQPVRTLLRTHSVLRLP